MTGTKGRIRPSRRISLRYFPVPRIKRNAKAQTITRLDRQFSQKIINVTGSKSGSETPMFIDTAIWFIAPVASAWRFRVSENIGKRRWWKSHTASQAPGSLRYQKERKLTPSKQNRTRSERPLSMRRVFCVVRKVFIDCFTTLERAYKVSYDPGRAENELFIVVKTISSFWLSKTAITHAKS